MNKRSVTIITLGLLFFVGSMSQAAVERKGQDLSGQKCIRTNADGTTTYGNCESVCKDLVVGNKDTDTGAYKCSALKATVNRAPKVTPKRKP